MFYFGVRNSVMGYRRVDVCTKLGYSVLVGDGLSDGNLF